MASLIFTLTLPAAQVSALIDSVGVTSIIFSTAINLTASIALLLGMFGLVNFVYSDSQV